MTTAMDMARYCPEKVYSYLSHSPDLGGLESRIGLNPPTLTRYTLGPRYDSLCAASLVFNFDFVNTNESCEFIKCWFIWPPSI